MPDLPEDMTGEELVQELEDIEAKLTELEGIILTNKLDYRDIRREVKGREGSPTPDVLEDKISSLEDRLEKDLEGVERWKDNFDKVLSKMDELDSENDEIRERLEEISGRETSTVEEPFEAISIVRKNSEKLERLEKEMQEIEGPGSPHTGHYKGVSEDLQKLKDQTGKALETSKEALRMAKSVKSSPPSDIPEGLEDRVSSLENKLEEISSAEDISPPGKNYEEIEEKLREVSQQQGSPEVKKDLQAMKDEIRGIKKTNDEITSELRDLKDSSPSKEELSKIKEKFDVLKSEQESISAKVDGIAEEVDINKIKDIDKLREEVESIKKELIERGKSQPVILE